MPGLTRKSKALYSSINLGAGAVDYIVIVFLLKYYTDYTGLDAGLAGIALLLGKAFDAVSDPLMGYISDHTRSRWGRRRPWFFAGALPLALSFAALFSASPDWSQTQLFGWLLGTNILFWTGNTMVMVPHAAFASEMTETHEERISVMGFGMISLLRKLSRSLAIGLSGIGLGFFGYISGSTSQSPEAIAGIRVMFCIVPAVSAGLTALALLWFPVNRARHEATLAELRRRRSAEEESPP